MTDRGFRENSQMEAGHDVDVNKVLGLDGPGWAAGGTGGTSPKGNNGEIEASMRSS